MDRRTCGNCAFYGMLPQEMTRGDCRFKPPQIMTIQTPKGVQQNYIWPRTNGNNKGCGEHRTDEENESIKRTEAGMMSVPA